MFPLTQCPHKWASISTDHYEEQQVDSALWRKLRWACFYPVQTWSQLNCPRPAGGKQRFLKACLLPRPAWKHDQRRDAQRETRALRKEIQFKDRCSVPPMSSSSSVDDPATLGFSCRRKLGCISGAPWNSKAPKYPRTGQRPRINKSYPSFQQAAVLPEKSDY